MKKFFSLIILITAIIFAGSQNNFASAREVYAGNVNYMSFYVETNSISVFNQMSFTVYVKKYDDRNGSLQGNNQWNFYVNRTSRESYWAFDYYLSGTNIPISQNRIAQNILRICQDADSRIFRYRR